MNQWAFAQGMGPITLAGLRYALAALTLGLIHLGRHHKRAGMGLIIIGAGITRVQISARART